MGKRKSSKKAPTKKGPEPLSTSFKCLFCHHEKSVTVKLDKNKSMFGDLSCKTCGQKYRTPINNLSKGVDVYYDWVDACEEAQEQQAASRRPAKAAAPLLHGSGGGAAFSQHSRTGEVEDDEDAVGEDDDDLDNPNVGARNAAQPFDEGRGGDFSDEEDDSRRQKKRRVADPDEDSDEE